jgi:molybdenum cofactor guanylyltransferase
VSNGVGETGAAATVPLPHSDVVGVVLAGGYSRRMGADKGGLPFEGAPAVGRLCRLLSATVGTTVVSLRPEQLAGPDAAAYAPFPCVLDDDPGSGPLGAIVSVSRHFPDRVLLVVAVDLVGLTADSVARLLAARGPGIAVVAARQRTESRSLAHPLCAVWEVPALDRATAAWKAGERSPRRVLEAMDLARGGSVRLVDIPFIDANTPGDRDRVFKDFSMTLHKRKNKADNGSG